MYAYACQFEMNKNINEKKKQEIERKKMTFLKCYVCCNNVSLNSCVPSHVHTDKSVEYSCVACVQNRRP